MKKYKPTKTPVFITMILVSVIFYVLYKVVRYAKEYIPCPIEYIQIPVAIVGGIVVLLLLPVYYFNTFYTVTNKAVTSNTGVLLTVKQMMPLSSVKSVTAIYVPFGNVLGYNIVILNAQGTNLMIPFIPRNDAKEITDIINNEIRKRASRHREEEP